MYKTYNKNCLLSYYDINSDVNAEGKKKLSQQDFRIIGI